MGLLDFLFGAAILNSLANHRKNNINRIYDYSNSYERDYKDGYEDWYFDHDSCDSAEHEDYYCDLCDHNDKSYGSGDCDCGCDDSGGDL